MNHRPGTADRAELARLVDRALDEQPVTDMHTHCYAPRFGHSADGTGRGMLLWGIDELVTYHYLVAEVFRVVTPDELPYETFWSWPVEQRADHIWKHLFVERTPISEACRGVLTTLGRLGLDPNEPTLGPYREWFARQDADGYVDQVMSLANVDRIVMTNAVFDDHERGIWESDPAVGDDPRFDAVLRIDPLLRDWPRAAGRLAEWGYRVSADFSGETEAEARRFLGDWLDRMRAIYVATSLPPGFAYPDPDDPVADRVIEGVLLPVLAERGLPWAVMIGSRLRVNPGLRQAGDMCGKADVGAVVNLCARFPGNRFLVTMLSRENQHELCVAARKFGNLMPFGCWWFLNNPSIIDEITRERIELLGTAVIPQHSDARVLDQLIYKWSHSRRLIARVLTDTYADLAETGYRVTPEGVRADAARLLRGNFRRFIGLKGGRDA